MKNLLIIDGPSAVGKSTIVNLILENNESEFEVAKRVTTRKRRNIEEDDLSYDFVDSALFEKMISLDQLVEYKHYLFGMSYGLPKQNVLDSFARNKHAIGIINLGNIGMVKKFFPTAFGVFLDTSIETIQKRLENRHIHTKEQIEERIGNAKKGLAFRENYDLVIKNEDRAATEVVKEILNKFNAFNAQILSSC